MKHMKKINKLILTGLSITAAIGLMSSVSLSAGVIVTENFDGSATGLNGKTADSFDEAFSTTGVWASTGLYKRDGTVVPHTSSVNRSANLDLGSYINDTKGNANGLFDLTMTVTETGTLNGEILTLGFSNFASGGMTTGADFEVRGGVATIGLRGNGIVDMWAGSGTSNGVDGGTSVASTRILTASLDLRTWNDTTDYGTVTWSDNIVGTLGSYAFTADTDFNYILLSSRENPSGTFDNLTLTQIPESSTYALLGGLLSLCWVMMRRRA